MTSQNSSENSPAGAAASTPRSTAETVLLDVTDGVATLTLNRPEAMNSLDIATKELLLERLRAVAADPAVRCVVLTGTGRAFCTGQDLKEHVRLLEEGDSDALFTTVDAHYNPLVTLVAEMDKPVVAVVNGVAAGAGASLAMACDLRVVADTAGFNLAFAGIALSCDTGASVFLPQLVGRAKAMELLYFPRTVPAAEALELGLATAVVPADELAREVKALTTRLAAGPTLAFGAMRRAVAHSSYAGFADALAFESEMMTRTGSSEDHRAAVEAFVAKQRPQFHGR